MKRIMGIVVVMGALAAPTAAHAQDRVARSCEGQAVAQGLQGDERKKFVEDCVKGPRKQAKGNATDKTRERDAARKAAVEKRNAAVAERKRVTAEAQKKRAATGGTRPAAPAANDGGAQQPVQKSTNGG